MLFHLIAITVWALPNPPSAVAEGKVSPAGTQWVPYYNKKYLKDFPPFAVYLAVTGFWQYWDMFAPDPTQTDYWGEATILFKDGSQKHYQYPRMALLGIYEKHVKERYRKFFERAGDDKFNYLWSPFACHIAYMFDNPSNPPVRVKLFRHWRPVAAPGQVQNPTYDTYMYYEYVVDQHELAQARKERS